MLIDGVDWRAPSPARGPLDRSRRSLPVLESLTATRFSTPDNWANEPTSCVASTRLGEVVTGTPVMAARCRHARGAYSGDVLMPVPIAVAPRLISQMRME